MTKKEAKVSAIKSGVYKHSELTEMLGSRMAVKRALAEQLVEKVSRGFYCTPDIATNEAYYRVIKKFYKDAVISKRTLLYHYRLTTNQPDLIDVDVPQTSKLRNGTDLLEVHRTNKIFGLSSAEFNGIKLKCYSVERALFDVLSFEEKPGSLTSEIIHNYLSSFKYEPAVIHALGLRFGSRGAQLANLIQVMAGDKF
ncbi:MAG TPA: hypothetical protein VIG33_02200 [Pseudobdellovibrionaceae bacterium]|jgi:predicted transcriptional regulator of viral defense system